VSLQQDQETEAGTRDAHAEDWLVGGGEMGRQIRAIDWTATPLGGIESWPQSLRTTISLCLASNFPISLAWGPKHIQIYNDGYWPICGAKHPRSMGQDFTECWASAWPVIGEAFERALGGVTSYLENQRMFLDRNGYLEETFFTFSFSPIRDETGGVGGLFHPVTETTVKMLAERRTRALRDLAARAGKAQASDEAFVLASQTLAELELDLPFGLFYRIDGAGTQARLAADFGLPADSALKPAVVSLAPLAEPAGTWPLAEVARGITQALQLDDLGARFGRFVAGPYPEAPKTALVLPIRPPGHEQPVALFVTGVSSRLPFNDTYRAFCDLVGAGVTTALANAMAYEEERKRALALAEIDRAKTAFFSNVSHEFRTPLTLMLGPLEEELAETVAPLPAPRRQRLETAHRNSLRLLKLVNTLLDFSRIESGRVQASYEPVDLAIFTEELASSFRSAIERAGLRLQVDCARLAEPIHVDRDMWEKIVLNLLSNALKHTFAGVIAVSLRAEPEHVVLRVADSGVGIPAAELPRLFERFHRVRGARSRTHEGTGIGLALVRELAQLHGGTVSVESVEGQGTTFTVRIRRGRAHLPADRLAAAAADDAKATGAAAFIAETEQWGMAASTQAPGPAPPSSESVANNNEGAFAAGPRPRIVWVDDNADMRTYVHNLLAPHYEVTAVSDGLAALTAVRARIPDLVLSDVMMPGLDGFGLVRELRQDPATQTLPIILLSARAGEESAVGGLDAGADDYLAKPFLARELLARVRTHLDLARLRRRWSEQLAQANRQLEAENRRVGEANRLKSEFLANMSHELRTPLNSVIGFSELVHAGEAGPVNERQREFLGNVLTGGRHLLQLINDVLDLAKVEAGKLDFRPQAVDPRAIIEEVVRILRPTSTAKSITVEPWVDPRLARIDLDPERLKQVLYNYLSNALKFTPTGGRVTVRAVPEDEARFRLEVADNGQGIAAPDLGRLFVEFQQLDGGYARKQGGTGLGLALTRKLVEAQGGSVGVSSTLGQGSVFHAVLPLEPGATGAVDLRRRFPAPPGAGTILVVEDDAADRAAIVDVLQAAGYGVDTAITCAEALAKCENHAYGALTLDLVLPDGNGLDVLRRLRATRDGLNRDVKVVVVTVVEHGGVAGFAVSEVLGKPLDPGALVAALRRTNVLPGADDHVLVVDDDPGSQALMAATLDRLGFRSVCHGEGGRALETARVRRPLAVVLDLMMPGVDGFQFLDRFRAIPGCETTPVVVWTVKDLSKDELGRLRASAQAVVAKGAGAGLDLLVALEAFVRPERKQAQA
jgi:signal transduction histidine kinase